MAKYANQFSIKKEEENSVRKDADHPYAKISIESIDKALEELDGYEFKLYLLLYMNQEGFEWDFSPAHLEKAYAGTRKTWTKARKGLEEKGYLRVEENGKMVFMERPQKSIEKVEKVEWEF